MSIERSSQPELTFAGARPATDDELTASMLHWLAQADDWITARDLCGFIGIPATDANKRRLRDSAQNSEGRIAGGQLGYKLIQNMTVEEYNRWRNWMKSQADQMTRRILLSDKHFYTRKPIALKPI